MVILVLGAGLAESETPNTFALSRVVVAEADPDPLVKAACAVLVTRSAVMVVLSRFTDWTFDELLALGPAEVICPKALSVIVPVVPTPARVTLATLTVVLPPVQPIVASAHGPLLTKADPTLATPSSP